jgi:hypothetical protein
MLKRIVVSLLMTSGLVACCAPEAFAETAKPGWDVTGRFQPTYLPPGGESSLIFDIYNVGAAPGTGNLTATVTLPPGVMLAGPSGHCSGTSVVTCTGLYPPGPATEETISEDIFPEQVGFNVRIAGDAVIGSKGIAHVAVSGGGALRVAGTSVPATIGTGNAPFGLSNIDAWFSNADGTNDTQAGSHPYTLTVAFSFNTQSEGLLPNGQTRAINVNLPPGIVGDPNVVPQCTATQFDSDIEEACPRDTVIGFDSAESIGDTFGYRVFNMKPPPGVAAQFEFGDRGRHIVLDARVRSGGDSGITEHANIPENHITYNTTTLWGDPAEHGVPAPSNQFLSLPTSCGAPQEVTAELLGTWENESARAPLASFLTHNNEGQPTGFTGCERLTQFNPTISLAPDTSYADTPAGLTATVRLPQGQNPEELAASGLKNTTVVLPQGIAVNPGQATGLVACQTPEENLGGEQEIYDGPPSCPSASKVGTDEISTPLLPDRLKGNVYILQQNPPNLQLLVAASADGVNLKLIGTVHLNETTGQLTTTFTNTPDAPLTEFVLSFSGGAQAALVTPPACGTYTSTAEFTPWASPFVSSSFLEDQFVINAGTGGSPCSSPLPFTPTMSAGATTDQAGGYTDFTLLLQRSDDQQHIERLQFKTPEGLLGMIAKVPLCPEPQAAAGTCSAASQIGHTVAEAGPGPYPFVIPEPGAPPAPIYLTGPYEGAPFGLSIAVPIVAGPFDLATEVVRAKIEVDRRTSQLAISTTAFPKTVKGIPTDIREIDAVIDRPEFMFNPTSCNPMSFSGTAYSFEGATEPLGSHFQMGSCRALKFQPNFKVSTSAKTSRTDGASLTAKIVYPTGDLGANQASSQSNINSIKVELPKQLPSRLTTLQKACTAAQFESNPAGCPKESVVGHATAITPVLPVPLTGPAYFVSHGGEAFPNLIVVLQGYGVTVELVGSTFISKAGITSSTFKQVPDVPIASFELTLPEGPYSALTANGDLCTSKPKMPTAFVGQNGAELHQSTAITVTGCLKKAKAKKKKTKHDQRKRGKKKG